MSDHLKELREKLAAKRARLDELFAHKSSDDDGKPVYDFQSVTADWLPSDVAELEGTTKSLRIAELANAMTEECSDMHDQVVVLEEAATSAKAFADQERLDRQPAGTPAHPEGPKAETKSFGERVVSDPLWKE